jgi:ribulose 1,5-bisphosphate synthetase/thiazole synthase
MPRSGIPDPAEAKKAHDAAVQELSQHVVHDFNKDPDLTGLKGQTALVTGGASGIGEAMARRLAEAGVYVVIADMNNELGGKIVDDLRGKGLQYVNAVIVLVVSFPCSIDVALVPSYVLTI